MPKVGSIIIRKMNAGGTRPLYSGKIDVFRMTGRSSMTTGRWVGEWNNVQGQQFIRLGRGQGRWVWRYDLSAQGNGLFDPSFWERTAGAHNLTRVLTISGIPPGSFQSGATSTGRLYFSANPQFRGPIQYILV